MPALSSGFGLIDAATGHIKIGTALPTTPEAYYGDRATGLGNSWTGGECMYLTGSDTGDNKLYIQTAITGRTPTWRTTAAQWTT